MKCRNCPHNAFTMIDGVALCLTCYRDFQNLSSNQVSSAYQAHRGMEVANSILKERACLQRTQTNHQRNNEMNTYNTHNNITVHGNNSGNLNTGKVEIKSNDITIANPTKSGINISLLTTIIVSVVKLIALCLRPLKKLFW